MNNNKRPIYNLDQIPNPETDPEFWATITDSDFKRTIILLMLNNLRRANSEACNDNQCRSKLAKLEQLMEMFDFPEFAMNPPESLDDLEEQ